MNELQISRKHQNKRAKSFQTLKENSKNAKPVQTKAFFNPFFTPFVTPFFPLEIEFERRPFEIEFEAPFFFGSGFRRGIF